MYRKEQKKYTKQNFRSFSIIVLVFALGLSVLLSSCGNLSEVHRFASNAEKSINAYKKLDHSFGNHCQKKCQYRALSSITFQAEMPSCDCKEPELSDKNIEKIQKVLVSYFKQLALVADMKNNQLSYDKLEKSLVEGEFIKKKDLIPYSNLATSVTDLITRHYRSKRLKSIVATSHSDVRNLLDLLAVIIEHNLIPTLVLRKTELKQIYHDLFAESQNAPWTQFNIQQAYFSELNSLSETENALKKYISGLRKVSLGHQSLYENKDQLKNEEVKQDIAKIALEINDIISSD